MSNKTIDNKSAIVSNWIKKHSPQANLDSKSRRKIYFTKLYLESFLTLFGKVIRENLKQTERNTFLDFFNAIYSPLWISVEEFTNEKIKRPTENLFILLKEVDIDAGTYLRIKNSVQRDLTWINKTLELNPHLGSYITEISKNKILSILDKATSNLSKNSADVYWTDLKKQINLDNVYFEIKGNQATLWFYTSNGIQDHIDFKTDTHYFHVMDSLVALMKDKDVIQIKTSELAQEIKKRTGEILDSQQVKDALGNTKKYIFDSLGFYFLDTRYISQNGKYEIRLNRG